LKNPTENPEYPGVWGNRLKGLTDFPPGRWSSELPNPAKGSFFGVELGGMESWASDHALKEAATNNAENRFINPFSKRFIPSSAMAECINSGVMSTLRV
jgi:hypothetical protein